MIKPAIALLLFCGVVYPVVKAAPPAIAEFGKGEKTKFSTLNHAKAKGLNMTISYPNSWKAKEGDRPNIVQKFVSDGGTGKELVLIVTKSVPEIATASKDDLKEFFTEDSLKDLVPDGATFVSGSSTKIEGLPAGVLEYSIRGERAGMVVDLHAVSYIFFSGTTMVQVQCQVASLPGSPVAAKVRMGEFRTLFTLVANSIILPDKWK